MNFTEQQKTFLTTYLNTPSPTWFEYTGQKVWLDYIKDYTQESFVDVYGTAVATINPWKDYKVVLEAHVDEISWFVNYIDDKGFIYVIPNGWSDPVIAPSKRVNIHTQKGLVPAVFGRPAIHTRPKGEKKVTLNNETIFLDCGCTSKEEVEALWVRVGDVIVYQDECFFMNDFLVGRALDNRVGGFMIAEVARRISDNADKLPFTLHIVNAVQEEIGLKGAEMIAKRLDADLALVTDVWHDTNTPKIDKKKEGDTACGAWPVLYRAPAIHNKLIDYVAECADVNKISYQRWARSYYSGTDTDAFAYSNKGTPSALVSLPLRYMHTTVESVHVKDVQDTIDLLYESILGLDPQMDWNYF